MQIFKPNERNERRLLKFNWTVALLGLIAFLQIYQLSNQAYANYQLKKDQTLQVGEAAEDFCFYTTRSLIAGNFSSRMFDEVTYKGLKADSNYFDFKDDETVKLVKVVGDQCRVITTSNGRMKGLLITLNKSVKNPLYYKAIQINEEDDLTAMVDN